MFSLKKFLLQYYFRYFTNPKNGIPSYTKLFHTNGKCISNVLRIICNSLKARFQFSGTKDLLCVHCKLWIVYGTSLKSLCSLFRQFLIVEIPSFFRHYFLKHQFMNKAGKRFVASRKVQPPGTIHCVIGQFPITDWYGNCNLTILHIFFSERLS
jgi:hypothetical protein